MPRVRPIFVIAGIFFGQAVLLLMLAEWASPEVVFVVAPLAGLVGAGACLAARRLELVKPASEEPWRLNAWGSLLAGLLLPLLGWSVGAEAVAMSWLVAALFVGLGTMVMTGKPSGRA